MQTVRTYRYFITLLAVLPLVVVPATADSRIEREFDLGGGGTFVLNSDSGAVTVEGTGGDKARIVITSRHENIEDYYDISFEGGSGRVEVDVDKRRKLTSWFGSSRGLQFEITVPRGTEIDIDTAGGSIEVADIEAPARLDTSGGAITARRMGGDVLADTSGGRIVVEQVDGAVNADTSGGGIVVRDVHGSVRADTSGGPIRIERVDGDIVADTSGGSIQIEEAGGHVRADTSGGGVTVRFAAGNSSGGSLSSSGGGVTAMVDPSADLEVDASSSGGSVRSDLEITVSGRISRTSLKGRLGAGGNTLRLRSSGGPVRIESN